MSGRDTWQEVCQRQEGLTQRQSSHIPDYKFLTQTEALARGPGGGEIRKQMHSSILEFYFILALVMLSTSESVGKQQPV